MAYWEAKVKIKFRCPPELASILPRPVAANRGHPDWLKTMPASAVAQEFGIEMDTVKRCPPFVDAMGCGFLMLLPCDIEVKAGEFEWHWNIPQNTMMDGMNARSPLAFHASAQVTGTPLFDDSSFVLKFNNFWSVELEAGWSLLVTHPFNRADLPFLTLTGLVDCDAFSHVFINFPAVWQEPDFEGTLAKGTPVAQCVPVKRQPLDFDFTELEGKAAEAFADSQSAIKNEKSGYRRRYRSR